jgi:hypothetical protein
MAVYVMNCKTFPQLYRIQNPANTLKFELKSKVCSIIFRWKNGNRKLIERWRNPKKLIEVAMPIKELSAEM